MDGLLDRYSDAELALLLDVADRANAITMERVARIRAEARAEAEMGKA